jgi:hypothetical protein
MIGDADIFRSITYFVIVTNLDDSLSVAVYGRIRTWYIKFLRGFITYINNFMASASAMCSASNVEVITQFCFLER